MGNNNDNTNMTWIPEPLGVKKRRPTRKICHTTKRNRKRNIPQMNKYTRTLYNNMEQYDKQDKQYFKELLEHCEQATNKQKKEWLVMAE